MWLFVCCDILLQIWSKDHQSLISSLWSISEIDMINGFLTTYSSFQDLHIFTKLLSLSSHFKLKALKEVLVFYLPIPWPYKLHIPVMTYKLSGKKFWKNILQKAKFLPTMINCLALALIYSLLKLIVKHFLSVKLVR